jgi:hypothetical protein
LPVLKSNVHRCLFGWAESTPAIEGGIPECAVSILATALLRQACVTFPIKKGRRVVFVASRTLDTASEAFHDGYFNWSQRGQVVFLSPPDSPVAPLTERHLDVAEDADRFDQLADIGVTGVVVPGVDGDVAGIYTFDAGLRDRLISSVRTASNEAGAEFQIVSEAEFIAISRN